MQSNKQLTNITNTNVIYGRINFTIIYKIKTKKKLIFIHGLYNSIYIYIYCSPNLNDSKIGERE